MTKDEALDKALEALEESVDLVREDYENAKKLYGNYPSRQARLLGMEDGLLKHEAAITAIKQARSAPVQEPVATDWERIARVQDAKLRAMCNDPTAFEQLCEIMDRYEALRPTPPAAQRQWVGLTDAEVMQTMSGDWTSQFYFARAIEAKLKEKNT